MSLNQEVHRPFVSRLSAKTVTSYSSAQWWYITFCWIDPQPVTKRSASLFWHKWAFSCNQSVSPLPPAHRDRNGGDVMIKVASLNYVVNGMSKSKVFRSVNKVAIHSYYPAKAEGSLGFKIGGYLHGPVAVGCPLYSILFGCFRAIVL